MAHINTPSRLSSATSSYVVGECPHCGEGLEATVAVSVVIDSIERRADHLDLETSCDVQGLRINHSCGSLAESTPRLPSGGIITNGERDAARAEDPFADVKIAAAGLAAVVESHR